MSSEGKDRTVCPVYDLEALVITIRHSVSLSSNLAVELQPTRRDATIASSEQ